MLDMEASSLPQVVGKYVSLALSLSSALQLLINLDSGFL